MGRGNVCVTGKYEGLWYVDVDYLTWFDKPSIDEDGFEIWEPYLGCELDFDDMAIVEYNELLTRDEFDMFKEDLVQDFTWKFMSFERIEGCKMIDREREAIMENGLFYVCLVDNEWSVAVELIQKVDPYGYSLEGLQKKHYQKYLDGLKECLRMQFDAIGTYGGAWTHGIITRECA